MSLSPDWCLPGRHWRSFVIQGVINIGLQFAIPLLIGPANPGAWWWVWAPLVYGVILLGCAQMAWAVILYRRMRQERWLRAMERLTLPDWEAERAMIDREFARWSGWRRLSR